MDIDDRTTRLGANVIALPVRFQSIGELCARVVSDARQRMEIRAKVSRGESLTPIELRVWDSMNACAP